MTIGKTIAFSFFLHMLFLSAALLSVKHIILGERIFFVKLKENSIAEQTAINTGDDPKGAETKFERKVSKKKNIIPLQDQKQNSRSDMKTIRETGITDPGIDHPPRDETGTGQSPLPEKADKSDESGSSLGRAYYPLSSETGDEDLSLKSSGGTIVELYPAGGGIGGQSLIHQIRAAIERAKIYPVLARKRKQEGTVVTGFSINSNGLPENIRIIKSSGINILDSAARDTIIRAAPFPIVKGSIEVPITFILK